MTYLKKYYFNTEKINNDNYVIIENNSEPINTYNNVASINTNIKILIDAGHGNNTIGKRSPYSASGIKPSIEFYEWKWNREIANKVVNTMKNMGYNIELLVTEDDDISLSERVKRVNRYCDNLGKENVILISIHSNACGNGVKWEKASGWEAYTSLGKTDSDELADIFYKTAAEMFPDKKIRYDLSDGDTDKEANFTLLKNTKCVAILTENFFYDNINDVQFILSDEGKKQIIDLHIFAIEKYLENKKGDH